MNNSNEGVAYLLLLPHSVRNLPIRFQRALLRTALVGAHCVHPSAHEFPKLTRAHVA